MDLYTFRPLFDEYEIRTGRMLAGLRGDSRETLDRLLISTLSGAGGRSAFVKAACDLVAEMDDEYLAVFKAKMREHEDHLAVVSPYSQGV